MCTQVPVLYMNSISKIFIIKCKCIYRQDTCIYPNYKTALRYLVLVFPPCHIIPIKHLYCTNLIDNKFIYMYTSSSIYDKQNI